MKTLIYFLTLQPVMFQVRDKALNKETVDMIMHCPVRFTTHLRGW
jgi:hypothetical protein